MEKQNISRWEVVKNTKAMMVIALIYMIAILACLGGVIRRTTFVHQIIFIVLSFYLLIHFRRVILYFGDIVQLRTKVFEGKVRKLIFGIDYDGKVKPEDYDIYELSLQNGEKMRFPCAHKVFDCDLVEQARFIFLESTSDLVKAEIICKTKES